MTYRLRFPFRSTHEVTDFTNSIALSAPGVQASLQPHLPYVVLNLEGFESEAAATEALPFAWGAVMLASVLSGWGFQPETTLDKVVLSPDPNQAAESLHRNFGLPITGPVHGLVNGNLPAVVPVEKNIRFVTAGDVTVHQSIPAGRLAPFVEQALSHRSAARALVDDRLKLALELWSDYHKERSLRAKFLTLVMALEVLARPIAKHKVAQAVLDRWGRELSLDLLQYAKDSDEYEAIDSLQREVTFRRERSIRGRIRNHVAEVVGAVNSEKGRQIASMAVSAYDLRGKLVHNGTLTQKQLHEGNTAALKSLRATLLAALGMRDFSSVDV